MWDKDGEERCSLSDPDCRGDLRVYAIAYQPAAFGENGAPRLLASGHADGWVRIWDVDAGKLVNKLGSQSEVGKHEGIVGALAYSVQGDRIATGCSGGASDSAVRIWDSKSGRLLQRSIQTKTDGHGYHVKSLAFAPVGDLLISGSEDFTAIVWKFDSSAAALADPSREVPPLEFKLRLGRRSFPPNANESIGHTGTVFHVGFAFVDTDQEPEAAITGSADNAIKIWRILGEGSGECLRTIRLSGPASCLSFWPRGDGTYDPNCFIAASGKSIFKIDSSREHCPTLCPRDLQQFVIFPDLRDKKWERTKSCWQRLAGSRAYGNSTDELDYSGCLLQRITRQGETGLHEAIKTGNFELAKVLCGARGGSSSTVLGMDFSGNTPWSVALAKYCFHNDEIERMEEKELEREAAKRGIDAVIERLDTKKQIRDRLKTESSIEEYKKLSQQLDFKGCLEGVQCGVFPFIAAIKSNPSMTMETPPTTQSGNPAHIGILARMSTLPTLVKHAEVFHDDKGFTIFDNQVADHLVSSQWEHYAENWFRQEFMLYFVLVLCYTVAGGMAQMICDEAVANATTMTGPVAMEFGAETEMQVMFCANGVSCLLLLRFILNLAKLNWARKKISDQNGDTISIRTKINAFQGVSYALGLTSAIVHLLDVALLEVEWWAGGQNMCIGTVQEVHAAAGGFLWVGILFYMRGFAHTEAAVPILQRILIDVAPYFMVLGTILVGCALTFMNLQRRLRATLEEDVLEKYATAQSSFLYSFSMMMGGFDIKDFVESQESTLVFVLFMIIVQLVMLNMLIAIMGDSVAQVYEDQKAAGLYSRAQLILTCQDCGHQSDIKNQHDKHVSKFFPVPVASETTKWSGVVNELKQQVKSLKNAQTDEMEAMQAKVESIELKLDAQNQQNQEMRSMVCSFEGKLDAVLNQLGQKQMVNDK